MKVYPYRTTYDKLTAHVARIEAEGDSVVQYVFVGGRDWVLLCREGARTREAVAA